MMAGVSSASEGSADIKFDTTELQYKLMTDITQMIQEYDFNHVLTEAVDSATEHHIQQTSS